MKQEKATTTEWDAASYEELADPMTRWGANFLEFVELGGDETVVDAGCGTGRVTELLLGRLPEGTLLAVDVSEKMVEAAAGRFAGDGRVVVERQDLLDLDAEEPADVIFSTATFHWILDHDRLFQRLAENLKPGGLLAAQCGGSGNVARVLAAAEEVMQEGRFREDFEGWTDAKYFADPATTKARLEKVGFEKVETWLHEEPTGVRFGRKTGALPQNRDPAPARIGAPGRRARRFCPGCGREDVRAGEDYRRLRTAEHPRPYGVQRI